MAVTTETCTQCQGVGVLAKPKAKGRGLEDVTCSRCNGKGRVETPVRVVWGFGCHADFADEVEAETFIANQIPANLQPQIVRT